MLNTISDFRLAESILQSCCKAKKCQFIDLPLVFSDDNVGYSNGNIHVYNSENVAQTINNIIISYLSSFNDIHSIVFFESEEHKKQLLLAINLFLRYLVYNGKSSLDEEPMILRAYQIPFLWIVFKDIICPVFDIQIENFKIVKSFSPYIDVCKNVDKTMVEENSKLLDKVPFVYLNAGISYTPCIYACLVVESIRFYGLDPSKIISEIYNSDLKNKLKGLADLEFKDGNLVNDFISLLSVIAGVENNFDEVLTNCYKNKEKLVVAQAMDRGKNQDGTTPWWFLGLIEKMIQPVRGSDWTTYNSLQPFFQEVWDKINVEREKRGREGLTYEGMLRVQSPENDDKYGKVIEKLLSSNRVW